MANTTIANKIIGEDKFFKIGSVDLSNDTINREGDKVFDGVLPSTPFAIVQFRTKITNTSDGSNNEKDWEDVSQRVYRTSADDQKASLMKGEAAGEISNNTVFDQDPFKEKNYLRFDNYLDSIEIEDNGGAVKCSIRLFDKDIVNLENIIIKAVAMINAQNQIISDNGTPQQQYILQFTSGKDVFFQNLRVKFGYSDFVTSTAKSSVITPASGEELGDASGFFSKRTKSADKNKMVMNSPWIYFQIMKVDFDLTDKGLIAVIEGMSTGSTYLDKARVVKRKWNMKGSPEILLRNIGAALSTSTSNLVSIIDWDKKGHKIIAANPNSSSSNDPGSGDYIKFEVKNDTDVADIISDQPISFVQKEYRDANGNEDTNKTKNRENIPSGIPEASSRRFEWWKNQISISLGGQPQYEYGTDGKVKTEKINGKEVKVEKMEFMSLSQLLNDYCSKVPPVFYCKNNDRNEEYYLVPSGIKLHSLNTSGGAKLVNDTNEYFKVLEGDNYKPGFYVPCIYTFEIFQTQTKFIYIRFYYRLFQENQEFIRKYTFRNSYRSIVKSLTVKSEIDFAQLSSKILNYETIDGERKINIFATGPTKTTTDKEGKTLSVASHPVLAADAMKEINSTDGFSLVSRTVEANDTSTAGALRAAVVRNMNENVFKGTIELLGDPFFLFDRGMSPYQYVIMIDVIRPRPATRDSTNNLETSYMSGLYYISKIKHSININGFKTSIEVLKDPSIQV